jgi:hypothetical protein
MIPVALTTRLVREVSNILLTIRACKGGILETQVTISLEGRTCAGITSDACNATIVSRSG